MSTRGTSYGEEVTGGGRSKEKGGGVGMRRLDVVNGDKVARLRAKRRVKVLGARKVWGTLRATTSLAVRNVISNIAKIPSEQLAIKRKYKESPSSRKASKWWFVIRGDEKLLQQLESKWQSISLLTAWKLQDVLEYADDSPIMPSDVPSSMVEPTPSGTTTSDDGMLHLDIPSQISVNSQHDCVPSNSGTVAPSETDSTNSAQLCTVSDNNDVIQSEIEHCSSVSQKPDASVRVDNEKHVSIDVDSDSPSSPFLGN